MQEVNGKWTIFGTTADDPKCIHNVDELVERIDKVGFMPLFSNDIPGFSVEEYTISEDWWCNDPKRDPWLWREIVAERQAAVYSKFTASFFRKKWVLYRRNGFRLLQMQGVADMIMSEGVMRRNRMSPIEEFMAKYAANLAKWTSVFSAEL